MQKVRQDDGQKKVAQPSSTEVILLWRQFQNLASLRSAIGMWEAETQAPKKHHYSQ
jgi:hypothetical protein